LPPSIVLEIPFENTDEDSPARKSNESHYCQTTDAWVESFFQQYTALTHLVSIERVGPSHTLESLMRQPRSGPLPREAFVCEVPGESRNVCHNMRGLPVDAHTAKAHRLFEAAAARSTPGRSITTIGVGDGGNEIGMGQVPWELLTRAIATGPAGRVACRIATDYTLLAGISNWGAYALAAGCCAVRGRRELLRPWTAQQHRRLIETLVRDAHAIDGLTRRAEPTVDGLSLDVYLRTYDAIVSAVP
jgi:hypothetical protein